MNTFLRKLKFKLTPKKWKHDHFIKKLESGGFDKEINKFLEGFKPHGQIIIMRGLPASGKSTKAKEMVDKGGYVRINKDLLRTMLHFDNFDFKREKLTRQASIALVDMFSQAGVHVIVDDTNLNERTIKDYQTLGSEYEICDIDTPMDQCLRWDKTREKKVGAHVIKRMALMSNKYPIPEKGFVIYDIDGTVADCEHRKHYVRGEGKRNWDAFFAEVGNDTRREEVYQMYCKDFVEGYKIIFVSGRPERCRADTEEWLTRNGFNGYETLLMRQDHDKRPDTEVKQEIYDKHLKHYQVVKIVDDRPSVIRMWKSNGLQVVDVGDGTEF